MDLRAGASASASLAGGRGAWHVRALGLAILAIAGLAGEGQAQRRRPPAAALPPAALVLAVSGGWTRDAAEAFAEDALCPDRDGSSWAARAGFRALGPILLEVLLGYHRGQDEADCVNGLIPPVPETGPFTRESTFFDTKYRGYPFYSTAARAAVELPLGRALRVRALGGMGVIWEKDVPFRVLGAELLMGRGNRSLFAEAERWWHDLPRETIREHYLDGTLIGFERSTEDVAHRTTLLRVGLEFTLGR